MKKIILFIIILPLLIINFSYSKLSNKELMFLNKIELKISKKVEIEGVEFINKFEKLLNGLSSKKEYLNNEKFYKMVNKLRECLDKQKIYLKQKEYLKKFQERKNNKENEQEKVNMDILRNNRLNWVNIEREKRGKNKLIINENYNWAAYLRSHEMLSKKEMSHEKDENDNYYNGNSIRNWLYERNININNPKGVYLIENVGSGILVCNKNECTNELIDSLKEGFDKMMAEEFEKNKEHYLTIIGDNFNSIGFGVARDVNLGIYYYTIYYIN